MVNIADGFTWISWDGEVPEDQEGYNEMTDLYTFDLRNKDKSQKDKTLIKKVK